MAREKKTHRIELTEGKRKVLSTFFRKFINLIHGKISRELYPHHIHKDASYPCIFYNPIES